MANSPRHTFSGAVLSLLIGTAYLVITLPRGTITLGNTFDLSFIVTLGGWGLRVNAWIDSIFPSFQEILSWVLWATFIYLAAIAILSIRHRQMNLLGWAFFMLVVSTAIFHVIAWGGFIAVRLLQFLGLVFSWLVGLAERLFAFLIPFIIEISRSILDFFFEVFQPLLGMFWWIGIVAAISLLAFIIYKFRMPLISALRATVRLVIWIILIGGGVFLLTRIWRIIQPFLEPIFDLIVRALASLLRILFLVIVFVVVLVAIATVGQLFLDQLKGATVAGNQRRGVILGSIAIGTTLAILLLVSNIYGTNFWLPSLVSQFSGTYLYQPAPTPDALITLAIIGLSTISVLANIPQFRREPSWDEFAKSLVYQVVGVFVTGALAAVGSQTE